MLRNIIFKIIPISVVSLLAFGLAQATNAEKRISDLEKQIESLSVTVEKQHRLLAGRQSVSPEQWGEGLALELSFSGLNEGTFINAGVILPKIKNKIFFGLSSQIGIKSEKRTYNNEVDKNTTIDVGLELSGGVTTPLMFNNLRLSANLSYIYFTDSLRYTTLEKYDFSKHFVRVLTTTEFYISNKVVSFIQGGFSVFRYDKIPNVLTIAKSDPKLVGKLGIRYYFK